MSDTLGLSYEQLTSLDQLGSTEISLSEALDEHALAAEMADQLNRRHGTECSATEVLADVRSIERERGWGRSGREFAEALAEVWERAEDIRQLDPPAAASAPADAASVALTAPQGRSWLEDQRAARQAAALEHQRILELSLAGAYDRQHLQLARRDLRGPNPPARPAWPDAPLDDSTGSGRQAQEVQGLIERLGRQHPGYLREEGPPRHATAEGPRKPHERITTHTFADPSVTPPARAEIERLQREHPEAFGQRDRNRPRLPSLPVPPGHEHNPHSGAGTFAPISRGAQHAGRQRSHPLPASRWQ